jgi:hypothetical protein
VRENPLSQRRPIVPEKNCTVIIMVTIQTIDEKAA